MRKFIHVNSIFHRHLLDAQYVLHCTGYNKQVKRSDVICIVLVVPDRRLHNFPVAPRSQIIAAQTARLENDNEWPCFLEAR